MCDGQELARLRRENERLRRCVEHYASEKHWDDYIETGGGTRIDCGVSCVYAVQATEGYRDPDGWEVARAALDEAADAAARAVTPRED